MSIVYVVYAVILLAGGAAGWARAKSVASLAVSGLCAALSLAAALLLAHHHPAKGLALGALVSLAVSIVFAVRFVKTRKPMPAIPLFVLSDLVLIASLVALALGLRGTHS